MFKKTYIQIVAIVFDKKII